MMEGKKRISKQQRNEWLFTLAVAIVFVFVFVFVNRCGYPTAISQEVSPPVVRLDKVAYNSDTWQVKGDVVCVRNRDTFDTRDYKVIVYVGQNAGELYPKPYDGVEMQMIKQDERMESDGSFVVSACSEDEENDKYMRYFCVFLVKADLKLSEIKEKANKEGRRDIWNLVRMVAVDEWPHGSGDRFPLAETGNKQR